MMKKLSTLDKNCVTKFGVTNAEVQYTDGFARVFAQSSKLFFLISVVSNDPGNKGPECGLWIDGYDCQTTEKKF